MCERDNQNRSLKMQSTIVLICRLIYQFSDLVALNILCTDLERLKFCIKL